MNLATLRPRTQIGIAVVVPLCAVIIGLVTVGPLVSGLRKTGRELETTQATIRQKQQVISQVEAAAGGGSLALAVALPSEDEPIKFLRQFAGLCAQSSVSLVSVKDAGAAAAAPSAIGGPKPVVPVSVAEVGNQVTVQGTFHQLVSLLVRMEGFERILSVSKCRLTSSGKAYPQLEMDFTLSRFVAKPAAAPAPKPAAPASP